MLSSRLKALADADQPDQRDDLVDRRIAGDRELQAGGDQHRGDHQLDQELGLGPQRPQVVDQPGQRQHGRAADQGPGLGRERRQQRGDDQHGADDRHAAEQRDTTAMPAILFRHGHDARHQRDRAYQIGEDHGEQERRQGRPHQFEHVRVGCGMMILFRGRARAAAVRGAGAPHAARMRLSPATTVLITGANGQLAGACADRSRRRLPRRSPRSPRPRHHVAGGGRAGGACGCARR